LLLAVGLVASADIMLNEPLGFAVSGDATLTAGVDLADNSIGFANAVNSNAKVTFFPAESTKEAGAMEGVSGWIKVGSDATLGTVDETGVHFDAGAVDAKLYLGPVNIDIDSAPGAPNRVTPIDTDVTVSNVFALDGTTPGGGFTLTYAMAPITAKVLVSSYAPYVENNTNLFNVGSTVTLALSPATVNLDVKAHTGDFAVLGLGTSVSVNLAPLILDLGFDATTGAGFPLEALAKGTFRLSEADADGNYAQVVGSAYFGMSGSTMDVDAKVEFTELAGDNGAVPALEAAAALTLTDLTSGTLGYIIDVSGNYVLDTLKPYFSAHYDNTGLTKLAVWLEITSVPKTKFTVKWWSDNLTGVPAPSDLGDITFATKITL
jgi:hypothetical protein